MKTCSIEKANKLHLEINTLTCDLEFLNSGNIWRITFHNKDGVGHVTRDAEIVEKLTKQFKDFLINKLSDLNREFDEFEVPAGDEPETYRIGDGVHCCFSCKHSEGPCGCKAPGGLVWVCLLHNFRCNAYATCDDWKRPQ